MNRIVIPLLALTLSTLAACTPQQIAAAIVQHNADLACEHATADSDAAQNVAQSAASYAQAASGDQRQDAELAADVAQRDAATAQAVTADACG